MNFSKKKLAGEEGTQIIYTYAPGVDEEETYPRFTLTATLDGIRLEGKSPLARNMQDLQDLARIISEVWSDYNSLITSPEELAKKKAGNKQLTVADPDRAAEMQAVIDAVASAVKAES